MKTIIVIFICLFALSACSVVRIQHGDATVTSMRIFMDSNLDGLKIKAPDGTSVSLNKKGDEVQVEALATILAAMAKAAVPVP